MESKFKKKLITKKTRKCTPRKGIFFPPFLFTICPEIYFEAKLCDPSSWHHNKLPHIPYIHYINMCERERLQTHTSTHTHTHIRTHYSNERHIRYAQPITSLSSHAFIFAIKKSFTVQLSANIPCVSEIWTNLTWFDFRLKPISGTVEAA